MSRVGNRPINIPEGTQVEIKNRTVIAKGKEGKLPVEIPNKIIVTEKDGQIFVKRQSDDRKTKALHGLTRTLIANAILGVNKPWEKKLKVVGTGYKVKPQGENLILEVGFSHPVIFKKREGVQLLVEGSDTIIVRGVDKQLVGQVAAQIRLIKKPDVYKGKGIRYQGEKIRLKPGKKAKAAGGVAEK